MLRTYYRISAGHFSVAILNFRAPCWHSNCTEAEEGCLWQPKVQCLLSHQFKALVLQRLWSNIHGHRDPSLESMPSSPFHPLVKEGGSTIFKSKSEGLLIGSIPNFFSVPHWRKYNLGGLLAQVKFISDTSNPNALTLLNLKISSASFSSSRLFKMSGSDVVFFKMSPSYS